MKNTGIKLKLYVPHSVQVKLNCWVNSILNQINWNMFHYRFHCAKIDFICYSKFKILDIICKNNIYSALIVYKIKSHCVEFPTLLTPLGYQSIVRHMSVVLCILNEFIFVLLQCVYDFSYYLFHSGDFIVSKLKCVSWEH